MRKEETTGATLDALLARVQIGELRARYGWHAARGDYEGIVSLFAPDGTFECLVGEKERRWFHGHEAIRQFLKDSTFPGVVYPMIHNEILKVDGDEAVGSCMMEARCSVPNLPLFGGYYHDRARNFDGTWLFTERRYFRYYPQFERSGLDHYGDPETGLAALHDRRPG